MSKLKTLRDLYVEQLQDLYNAEQQLIEALPEMVKHAGDASLKTAFQEHLAQTRTHAERIERICDQLEVSANGEKCKAMQGLIAEGKDVASQPAEPEVRDAALIAAAQRVEHYEIAGYGCVRSFAEVLGYPDQAELLGETLSEESETDLRLTEISAGLNLVADKSA